MRPYNLHELPSSLVAGRPASTAADTAATKQTVVRLDRAQVELRHGRELFLSPRDESGPVLLVAAIETMSNDGLAALAAWGPLKLLLTAERMLALHGAAVSSVIECPSPVTLPDLRHWMASGTGLVDAQAVRQAKPADSTMRAALRVAKRARLAPALVAVELPRSREPHLDAAGILQVSVEDVEQTDSAKAVWLQRISEARVPIAAREDCTLVLFRELGTSFEHVAVLFGTPDTSRPVPVRLHSSCLTGDLLGSLRCDCGDQLNRAVSYLARSGGVLLYLSQEGRGTGLANKLRAYGLQDGGLDTIDADQQLGFRDDERDYRAAVAMLKSLGISRIELLTNNPRKVEELKAGGIEVVARVALQVPTNAHNQRYLATKRDRAGHLGADPAL